jgi:hypothetical protein
MLKILNVGFFIVSWSDGLRNWNWCLEGDLNLIDFGLSH